MMISIDELKKKLYEVYKPSYIAKILDVSNNQVYRLLNGKSEMSISQYNILIELIEKKE